MTNSTSTSASACQFKQSGNRAVISIFWLFRNNATTSVHKTESKAEGVDGVVAKFKF